MGELFTASFVREFVPVDQEVAYAQDHVFYGKTYQSDLRPVIEELAPDVVMVDVQLRYAILEVLRVDKPLIALCHLLYGAVAGFDDRGSARFEELNQAALGDGVAAFTSRRGVVESADCVLVFSYAGFDPLSGPEVGKKVVHVGPFRAASTVSSSWARRLPDRRLVLISLSTTDQSQGATLQRLCDAAAQLDVEAVVTTGPMVAPGDLQTSENVTVIEFVNHDEVLPETDLLVTHAGHGTVAAGLSHGVPMLCIPFGRDQNLNADRVEALELGTVLGPDSRTDVFCRAIRDMLDDDALRERAKRLADSLQEHPGIQDALTAIDNTIGSRPS